jgi:hypothetical protein
MALLQNTTFKKEALIREPVDSGRDSEFNWRELWYWGTLLVAVVADLLYIKAFAVDVIRMDEWAFIPYLQQFNEGRLDYAHFLSWQQNEHKPFFPLMLLFTVARLTHYDVRALQYAGLAIVSLTAVVVLLLARKRLLAMPFGTLTMCVVAAFMLDLRQWENLINGFSGSTVAVSMFFVLCVYFLDAVKKFDWWICLAIANAFFATYSCANGLLCWPLGIFMLLSSRALAGIEQRRAMLYPLAVWLVASGAVVSFYLSTYQGVHKDFIGNITALCSRGHLWDTIQTFFVALANPLAFEPFSAVGIGAAIFLILSYVFLAVTRGKWRINQNSIAPLALLLFGLLSTAMIFIGRAVEGASALLPSRYASITCLTIVGLLIFVASLKTSSEEKRTAVIAALVYAMFVTTIASGLFGLALGKEIHGQRLVDAQILKNYKNESDERLSTLMPFPKVLRVYAKYVEEQHYSVFRRP